MASTDGQDGARVVALGQEHLPGCLKLSQSANWNQNEADWRLMLGRGRGWGITLDDGALAASTIVLPYGSRFAWVSMVLVLPAQRRKGYATHLLRVALAELEKGGQTPILDATPAGHEVYLQEGFRDTWGFKRYALGSPLEVFPVDGAVRSMQKEDWPQIVRLDAPAFGASREPLLRDLAVRLPHAALVSERDGKPSGFVLGRDGREANQVGPLVAQDEKMAIALFAAALGRTQSPIFADIADHAPALQAWALERGFVFQRPFTRMVHGGGQAPGDKRNVYVVAGPELG